ncbi:MAG: ribosomal protein [Acidobacteria bacterium]|jgi:large subunit ribosomal protein L10|nr:ribosomal protein [Acidobacteriota bacterium]
MKTRERKQQDLNALTEQLSNSKSAMVVSFNKLTVNKDQEFRNQLRSAGANYQVVKNTIARLAVKGTPYEGASEYFKGVTGIAWTDNDPVVLSKAVSKFVKDNADIYTFKAGVVEGRVVDLKQIEAIASLPSKEELISKLLFVINAQAQRLATVINAVPRNLAIVIKQIGDAKPAVQAEQKSEAAEATQEQPAAETTVEAAETTPNETEAVSEQNAAEPEVNSDVAPETEQSAEQTGSPDAAPEAETESAQEAEPEKSE